MYFHGVNIAQTVCADFFFYFGMQTYVLEHEWPLCWWVFIFTHKARPEHLSRCYVFNWGLDDEQIKGLSSTFAALSCTTSQASKYTIASYFCEYVQRPVWVKCTTRLQCARLKQTFQSFIGTAWTLLISLR